MNIYSLVEMIDNNQPASDEKKKFFFQLKNITKLLLFFTLRTPTFNRRYKNVYYLHYVYLFKLSKLTNETILDLSVCPQP